MIERREQGREDLNVTLAGFQAQIEPIKALNARLDEFVARTSNTPERIREIETQLERSSPAVPIKAIERSENGGADWYKRDVLEMDVTTIPLPRPGHQGFLFDSSKYTPESVPEPKPLMQQAAAFGLPFITISSLLGATAPTAEVTNIEVAPDISAAGNLVSLAIPNLNQPLVFDRNQLTPSQNAELTQFILGQYEPREKVEDPKSIFKDIRYIEQDDELHISLNANQFRDGTPITIDRLARVHNMDARDLFEMVKDQLGDNPDPNVIPPNTTLNYVISNPLKVPAHNESEPGNVATMGTAGNIASEFGRWEVAGAADLLNAMGMDEKDATELIANEDYFVVPAQATRVVAPKLGEGAAQLASRLGIDYELFLEANATNGYLWAGTEYAVPSWTTMDGEGPGVTSVAVESVSTAVVEVGNEQQDNLPVVTIEDAVAQEEGVPARRETDGQEQPPSDDEQDVQLPDGEVVRDFTEAERQAMTSYNALAIKLPKNIDDLFDYYNKANELGVDSQLVTLQEFEAHINEVSEKLASGEYDAQEAEAAHFRFFADNLISDEDIKDSRFSTKEMFLARRLVELHVLGYTLFDNGDVMVDGDSSKRELADEEAMILIRQLVIGSASEEELQHGVNFSRGAPYNDELVNYFDRAQGVQLSELLSRLESVNGEELTIEALASGVYHNVRNYEEIEVLARMYGVSEGEIRWIYYHNTYGDGPQPANFLTSFPAGTEQFMVSGIIPEGDYEDYHKAPEITTTNETALEIWNTHLYLRQFSTDVPYPSEWDLNDIIGQGLTSIQVRNQLIEEYFGGGSFEAGVVVFVDNLEFKYPGTGENVLSGTAMNYIIEGLKSGQLTLHGVEDGFKRFMDNGNEIELYGLNEAQLDGYDHAIDVYEKAYDMTKGKHDLGYEGRPDLEQLISDAKEYANGTLNDTKLRERIADEAVKLNEDFETINDFYRFTVREKLVVAGIGSEILSDEEETFIANQIEKHLLNWSQLDERIDGYLNAPSGNLAADLAGGIIIEVDSGWKPIYIADWTGSDVAEILDANGVSDETKFPTGPAVIPGVYQEPTVTYESVVPQETPSAPVSPPVSSTNSEEVDSGNAIEAVYQMADLSQFETFDLKGTEIERVLKAQAPNEETGHLSNDQLEIIGPEWGGMQLYPDAAEAFRMMNEAFKAEFGHDIELNSTYRDYDRQAELRQEAEDAGHPGTAAKAGNSIHGIGLAIDVGDQDPNSSHALNKNQPEHAWLEEHMAEYGWETPAWADDGVGTDEDWHKIYIDRPQTANASTGSGIDTSEVIEEVAPDSINIHYNEGEADGFPSDAPAEYKEHPELANLSDSFWDVKREQPSLDYAEEHYNSSYTDDWGPTLKGEDVAVLAYASGFQAEDELVIAIAIARAESRFAAFVYGDDDVVHEGDRSIGPMQDYESPHRGWSGGERNSVDNLDPLHNFQSARTIFLNQGWDAWTTYTNGAYKNYLDDARQYAQSAGLIN